MYTQGVRELSEARSSEAIGADREWTPALGANGGQDTSKDGRGVAEQVWGAGASGATLRGPA